MIVFRLSDCLVFVIYLEESIPTSESLSCCSEDFFFPFYTRAGVGKSDQSRAGPALDLRLVWVFGVTAKPVAPSSLEHTGQPQAKFLPALPSS